MTIGRGGKRGSGWSIAVAGGCAWHLAAGKGPLHGQITSEQAEAQIELFQKRRRQGIYHFPETARTNLMNTFRQLSAETPRLGCRTMDIFHVACAVEIAATEFLTFDQRQAALAAHAGLKVTALV